MRRTPIDWHELSLAVGYPGGGMYVSTPHPSHGFTQEKLLKLFKSSPLHAPCLAWKYKYFRTGLSPFVLAYLTKWEGGPEPLHEMLCHSTKFYYRYCGTTRLPVASSAIRCSFSNEIYTESERHMRPAVNSWDYPSIQASFESRLLEWTRAESLGILDDEFVRTFGGHPIKADAWLYLKGMADMYA